MTEQKEQVVESSKSTEISKKEIIQNYFHPETLFTFTSQDIARMEAVIAPFKMLEEMINASKKVEATNGKLKGATEDDFQKDETGKIKFDQRGQPLLRENFWETKKESNSLTIDEKGTVSQAQSN